VVADSATNTEGDNPVVIFIVKERYMVNAPQWRALAINTIASRQGQTIIDRIKNGRSNR
jgi:hypothetical protein